MEFSFNQNLKLWPLSWNITNIISNWTNYTNTGLPAFYDTTFIQREILIFVLPAYFFIIASLIIIKQYYNQQERIKKYSPDSRIFLVPKEEEINALKSTTFKNKISLQFICALVYLVEFMMCQYSTRIWLSNYPIYSVCYLLAASAWFLSIYLSFLQKLVTTTAQKIFWISQCTLYPLRFFQVYTSFYFFVLNIFHMLPNILLIFFAYFKPKNNDDPVHDKNYLWPEKLNRYLLDPDSALTKYFLCYNCHPEYQKYLKKNEDQEQKYVIELKETIRNAPLNSNIKSKKETLSQIEKKELKLQIPHQKKIKPLEEQHIVSLEERKETLPTIQFQLSEQLVTKSINKESKKFFQIEVTAGIQKQMLLYQYPDLLQLSEQLNSIYSEYNMKYPQLSPLKSKPAMSEDSLLKNKSGEVQLWLEEVINNLKICRDPIYLHINLLKFFRIPMTVEKTYSDYFNRAVSGLPDIKRIQTELKQIPKQQKSKEKSKDKSKLDEQLARPLKTYMHNVKSCKVECYSYERYQKVQCVFLNQKIW